MPDRDFVEKLQRELGEELKKKESGERAELDKAEAIKRDGPWKWEDLQEAVGNTVNRVNTGRIPRLLTFFRKKWSDFGNKNRFSVASASGNAIEVWFEPDSANIKFRSGDSEGTFEAGVRDHAVFYIEPKTITGSTAFGDDFSEISIQSMAEKLLSLLE